MEKNDENARQGKLQPLYGLFERAIASNDAEQMRATAAQLRERKNEHPDIEAHVKKLEDAIARLSPDR